MQNQGHRLTSEYVHQLEAYVHMVKDTYLLNGSRHNFELGWNVTSEDTGFQCLYMATHVRLRC